MHLKVFNKNKKHKQQNLQGTFFTSLRKPNFKSTASSYLDLYRDVNIFQRFTTLSYCLGFFASENVAWTSASPHLTASFKICSCHKNSLRNTQLHHDDNMFILKFRFNLVLIPLTFF